MCWSCRGPKFSSQHPQQVADNPPHNSNFSGSDTLFCPSQALNSHVQIHMYMLLKKINRSLYYDLQTNISVLCNKIYNLKILFLFPQNLLNY